jgi:predicted RNA-binding Zn-ribbon protein involved in translation (DUF1610 family)
MTNSATRNQVQITIEHDEPCPRCGSTAVRAVVYANSVDVFVEPDATDAAAGALPNEDPLFDCRECGFEWGELVRDLMS